MINIWNRSNIYCLLHISLISSHIDSRHHTPDVEIDTEYDRERQLDKYEEQRLIETYLEGEIKTEARTNYVNFTSNKALNKIRDIMRSEGRHGTYDIEIEDERTGEINKYTIDV